MLNRLKDFLGTLTTPETVRASDEQALQLATAVLLIEVMRSDGNIAPEEQAKVQALLKAHFRLTNEQVLQLVAHGDRHAREAYDFQRFTSLINSELDLPERVRIIEFMWQVAYADNELSAHENHLMRKIADLLYIPHGDYVHAKMRAKGA